MPEMSALFSQGLETFNTSKEKEFVEAVYPGAENISIDYGILERAGNVYVKKAGFDWNDLGTWGALYEKSEKDECENTAIGAVPFVQRSKGNMIFAPSEKLIVIEGMEDYIIVDTDKALLVFPKEKEQQIKELVGKIEKKFGGKYS